ncbi:MAG: TIGR02594 family protein [Pseudomonadota bacterium]
MQEQPQWLAIAWAELGQKEWRGTADNPRIVDLFRDVGHAGEARDEVAWCAAFLGACLERAEHASTRSLRARSYLTWGQSIAVPRLGAVAVLSRGSDPALGHVGFVVGETPTELLLLGGNQGDEVTVEAFDRARLLDLRWPADPVVGEGTAHQSAGADRSDATFERALAHVLEMEGGYSDDPHDPGGATMRGITIGDYARERGVTLDATNRAQLTDELKRIPDALVKRIYLARYWKPSGAAELAPGLALMHFDAAVNQGVGTAIRILQQAVGARVDGEVGPETRAAIDRSPTPEVIAAYAEIRRRRYRELGHFWRFGRGWLNRVAKTEALALAWQQSEPATPARDEQKGPIEMTRETGTATEPKWWGESMTIWGALLTALTTVLPVIGPLIGINITAELITALGEQLVNVVQALAGLAGILMTVFGRVRASQPLTRRTVSLRL